MSRSRRLDAATVCEFLALDDPKTPAAPSERIRGSRRNRPGSASRPDASIKVPRAVDTALRRKVRAHNATHSRAAQRATLGALKAVWRRGAGAFSRSHRPSQTRASWAMARVNAYLHLLATGAPRRAAYRQDNDLLPAGHPRATV